jgi:hypothetical protein
MDLPKSTISKRSETGLADAAIGHPLFGRGNRVLRNIFPLDVGRRNDRLLSASLDSRILASMLRLAILNTEDTGNTNWQRLAGTIWRARRAECNENSYSDPTLTMQYHGQ